MEVLGQSQMVWTVDTASLNSYEPVTLTLRELRGGRSNRWDCRGRRNVSMTASKSHAPIGLWCLSFHNGISIRHVLSRYSMLGWRIHGRHSILSNVIL